MSFAYPEILILLTLLTVIGWFVLRIISKRKKKPYFAANTDDLTKIVTEAKRGSNKRNYLLTANKLLLIMLIASLIIVSARPQTELTITDDKKGVDIVLLIDLSSSMEDTDIKPTRLIAAKNVITEFSKHEDNNRVGLIAFTGSTITLSPLTFDKKIITYYLEQTSGFLFTYDETNAGTAIGESILSAVRKFPESKPGETRTKVIILITDGESNGKVDPITATKYANDNGVLVYPISMSGTSFLGSTEMLAEIAKMSDTELFKPATQSDLATVFNKIDTLEKSKLDTTPKIVHRDIYTPFVISAWLFMIGYLVTYLLLEKKKYVPNK